MAWRRSISLFRELDVIPLEVKSSVNTSSKSLAVYIGKYNPVIAVMLSGKDFSLKIRDDGTKVISLPLPMTRRMPKFLEIKKNY